MKVLLIDDTKFNLVILEKMLQRQGHKCVSLNSSPLALERLLKEEFDLVILDYSMPDLNGVEFYKKCHELLYLKQGKSLPAFIMVTAFKDKVLDKQCKKMGFVCTVSKPLKKSTLSELIALVMSGEYKQQQELEKQILVVGTGKHVIDILNSNCGSSIIDVHYEETFEGGLNYCKKTPDLDQVFCADIFPDGSSILDFSQSIGDNAQFDDQGVPHIPTLIMVLSGQHNERQRQLVEKAMRQNIREILTFPVSPQRIRQLLGAELAAETPEVIESANILVVDDIQFNAFFLEKNLNRYGNCISATSGQSALSAFHTNPDIQFVVCDLQIADMNGIEIYKRIQDSVKHNRSHKKEKNRIPFVFITACDNKELQEKAMEIAENNAEDTYFFKKPVDLKALEELAKNALGFEEDPLAYLFTK